jgi:hypothetical protein
MTCLRCGGLRAEPNVVYGWAGKWCNCPPLTNMQLDWTSYHHQPPCDHCHCIEEKYPPVGTGGKTHVKCCMCGHRRLK